MINGFLVPVLDIVESGDIGRSLQAKDSFHPTLFGYQFAANRLFEAVEAQLIGNLPAPAQRRRCQIGNGLRSLASHRRLTVSKSERGFVGVKVSSINESVDSER